MGAPGRPRASSGPGTVLWLLLGGGLAVVVIVAFGLGMLVGQQWLHSEPPAEAVKKPAPPRRSGLAAPVADPPPQEKLTFYRTLTAPLDTLPAASKVEVAGKVPEAAKPRPERPAAAEPLPEPARSRPAPAEPAPPSRAAEAPAGDWAVQVGAFRDRSQAESVRRPLAAAGLDAYVSATVGADGRLSYRVRVGGFRSRDEAERLAARVRQERSLATFVTSR